ncbi:MAG TPA: S41 family peptidase [Kofleriaceae bacterium]|jgi:carboxyl-terminal processing protease|nr:S41 family peptidase [Kofleriaceae bacterium]
MSKASHAACFCAGAILATAALAVAVPKNDVQRFKTFDAFAQSLALVENNYVDQVDEQTVLRDGIKGMLHNLDVHSTFLPPKRYQKVRQDTEGEFGSVGVVLAPGFIDDARPSVPPYPVIDEVAKGTPAEVAGIQIDDRLVSIDGQPTAEKGKELKEAGAWEAKLRGASGTRVTLGILRVGWKDPRAFTLVRAQVKQTSVEWKVIEPHVGYLSISRFVEATNADVTAALEGLRAQNALGALVLDLRDDPGGIVDQAVLVADQFLDTGTIVTIRGRKGSVETQTAHKGGAAVGVPLTILVDQGTASAAEILAAALHDHDRGKLVGQPTYGKGTVQTFYDLEDGSGLKLTTARYLTPKGNFLESKGLMPDVRIDDFAPEEIVAGGGAGGGSDATMNEADADEDPQLAAALKLAKQQLKTPNK